MREVGVLWRVKFMVQTSDRLGLLECPDLSVGCKRSRNWTRQTVKVAKAHRKVRLQTEDYNHELSRMLVNRFGAIVFEKLHIQNMVKNHSLAKSITDAGWAQLQTFTSHKAAEAGATVKLVDPYGTTVDCSRCRFHVLKPLSERIHHGQCAPETLHEDISHEYRKEAHEFIRGRNCGTNTLSKRTEEFDP